MLCREIIVVYSKTHTKRIHTFCGHNAKFFSVTHVVSLPLCFKGLTLQDSVNIQPHTMKFYVGLVIVIFSVINFAAVSLYLQDIYIDNK
jgi:hypothetical protein